MSKVIAQIRGSMPENGAATQAVSIGVEMMSRGYEVQFVSSGGRVADQLVKNGLNHTTIPALGGRTAALIFQSVFALKRLFVEKDVEIVHAHNAASLMLSAFAAILAGRFRRTKFFLSVHGVELRRAYWFRNGIFPLSQFAGIFPVSRYTGKLLQGYGVLKRNMVVTYNGIDMGRFDVRMKGDYRKDVQKELGIPEDGLIVGLVGRQAGFKGHRDAVKVFSRLYADYANVYLVLVGAGEEEAANKELANELGIIDRVRFMGYREDVERFHAAFDVQVLFSRSGYEMFPCSLLEGMAFGVPFVSVNTTGVPELAEDGQGIICECMDLDSYEEALRSLIESPENRKARGAAGLKAMRSRFNIRAVGDLIEESYIGR